MVRTAPARQRLRQTIEKLLDAGNGELLESERVLAGQLGGSRSTLRLALEDLARVGRLRHVPGKGWQVRRRQGLLWIKAQRSRPSPELINGLRSVLPEDCPLEVVSCPQPVTAWSAPPWDLIEPRRHRVVLLFHEHGAPEHVAQALDAAGVALCCVNCNLHRNYDTVCADYAQMSRLLVEEAEAHGHRHIAFVGARSLHLFNPAFMARVHGYRVAMQGLGLEPHVILLGGDFEPLHDQFATWLAEREAVGRRPTCLYLSGPGFARRLGRVLARLGLAIPEDVSVAGFGGSESGDDLLHYATYTRIIEPWSAVGQAAGLRCLARLATTTTVSPVLTLVPSVLRSGDSIRHIGG